MLHLAVRHPDEVRKGQQLHVAGRALNAADGEFEVRFEEDLYTPFYGGRQFSVRDINGVALIFWQPEWLCRVAGRRFEPDLVLRHASEAAQVLRRPRIAGYAAPTLPAIVRTVHAALIRGPQLSGFRAGAK